MSGIVWPVSKVNPASGGRKKFGKFFCPFDHADTIAKEIIVEADLEGVESGIEAIEVEMVEGEATVVIFVNQAEGRTGDRVRGGEARCEAFDEVSFSCAEIAGEGDDIAEAERFGDGDTVEDGYFRAGRNDHSRGRFFGGFRGFLGR